MKVLFVSVSGGLGGAERVLVESVAALRARQPGWNLQVLGFEPGPIADELAQFDVRYDVVDLPPHFARLGESGRSALITAAGLASSAPALLAYKERLRDAIDRHDPDVVHSNGLKSHVLTAWTVRSPRRLVWHLHDFAGRRKVSSWLLRRHAGRAGAIVANSQAVADDLRRVVGGRARVEVIFNGVDTTRFTPLGPAADLDVLAGLPPAAPGTVRVGLVATYARWKGHEVFLESIARIAGDATVRAYVVGGPQYQTAGSQLTRDELERLVAQRGLTGRVGLVGFQRDTAPVYRALDVVAHTSTEPEPFGLAIVEAMACGRPVVISHAGGAAEIARACEGAPTFPPGDATALAEVLARLAADRSLRDRLGRSGRDAALGCFSRERMGLSLSALYESVASPRVLAPARA